MKYYVFKSYSLSQGANLTSGLEDVLENYIAPLSEAQKKKMTFFINCNS